MKKRPTRWPRPRPGPRQQRALSLQDHETRRAIGLDQVFAIEDSRAGAQEAAPFDQLGLPEHANVVRSLMASAEASKTIRRAHADAIYAARAEKVSARKREAWWDRPL